MELILLSTHINNSSLSIQLDIMLLSTPGERDCLIVAEKAFSWRIAHYMAALL